MVSQREPASGVRYLQIRRDHTPFWLSLTISRCPPGARAGHKPVRRDVQRVEVRLTSKNIADFWFNQSPMFFVGVPDFSDDMVDIPTWPEVGRVTDTNSSGNPLVACHRNKQDSKVPATSSYSLVRRALPEKLWRTHFQHA